MKKTFKKGDSVFYYTTSGDTVPATVVRITPKMVVIHGNFLDGNYNKCVSERFLEFQDAEYNPTREEIIEQSFRTPIAVDTFPPRAKSDEVSK